MVSHGASQGRAMTTRAAASTCQSSRQQVTLRRRQNDPHRIPCIAEMTLTRSHCNSGPFLKSCVRTPPIAGLLAPEPFRSREPPSRGMAATILTLKPLHQPPLFGSLLARRPSWEGGSSDARKRPNQGSELFLSKLLQTCTGTNAGNRLNLVA